LIGTGTGSGVIFNHNIFEIGYKLFVYLHSTRSQTGVKQELEIVNFV